MALPVPTAPAVPAISPLPSTKPQDEGFISRFSAWWERAAFWAIMALAAALRLPNLATNPGWDGDEGYNYNIALNLAHGHHQMFALDFAFVQHPPLFFALAAVQFRVAAPGMLALRLLSIAFCLGTLALLPALGRALADVMVRPGTNERITGARNEGITDARIGLLAALAYAVWPFAVVQNRFGYTYNGLAFWTALALLALLRYRRDRTLGALALCGMAVTAALATDQEGMYLLPVLILGLSGASLARRAVALGLALAGPALYVSAMAVSDRAALVFDLTHTANRVTGGPLLVQGMAWLYNLADLLRIDLLIPLGLAGLALVPYPPARRLVLGMLATMLLVILKVRDPNPLFRTAEPLLPLVCLGIGALGAAVWTRLERPGRAGLLLVALMAVAVAGYDARLVAGRLPTPIEGLLPRSTAGAQAMAGWLNARLHPDDVVLAMPQVSWLLHARTAEPLQAVAATGEASAFYPAGIPCRRWVYDARLAAARFLVVDGFTRAWIAQSPPERALVSRAAHGWRLVYARGEYDIYENPAPNPRPCGPGGR